MANSSTGVIAFIGQTQDLKSKSGTPYKLRDLIINVRRYDPNTGEPVTDNENTPQFTFMGERCAELDKYAPGQMVTVYFDLYGRKYTDASGITKIINDIRPYKIEPYGIRKNTIASVPTSQPQSAQQPQVQSAQPLVQQPSAPVQPNGWQPPF